jgi:hypothetical protein
MVPLGGYVSRSIHLFIDSSGSLDALRSELSNLLNIPFERFEENGDFYYVSDYKPYCYLTLMKNIGMENDADKNFEDFRYHLRIRARRISDWEAADKGCLDMGRLIFERLKQMGQSKLMLTLELGTKLDSFSPQAVSK